MYFRLLFVFGAITCSYAQPPQVAINGVQTAWDVRTIIDNLIKENDQSQNIFNNLQPQAWTAKGASPVYVDQWRQAQQQTRDVVSASRLLSQKTDNLSLALDEYFRLEALDVTARSLEEGARRYAERSSADKLSALIAHNFSAREQLRDYLSNLAISEAQNFKIADEEAQRCRGMISREPATKKSHR